MSICFVEQKSNNLCASSQQTTSSKVLAMPLQQGIFGKSASKINNKVDSQIYRHILLPIIK